MGMTPKGERSGKSVGEDEDKRGKDNLSRNERTKEVRARRNDQISMDRGLERTNKYRSRRN